MDLTPATPADSYVPPPVPPVSVSTTPSCVSGRLKFRHFSELANSVAPIWASSASETRVWQMDPDHKLEEGVEGGFWVKDPPLSGYAKPRKIERLHVNSPIAATEKIASDLAYELDLPVPPVTLFSRETYPKTEMGQHAVSLPPFSEVITWGQICGNPELDRIARLYAQGAMSAILPFDTWLHCHDHSDHGGNLLVSILGEETCNFAFIDYSWSLAFSWKLADFKENYVAPCYDSAIIPDLEIVKSTIQAIESLDDSKIVEIVERIPEEFLTLADSRLVLDGLIYRKQNLRSIIGTRYPEVAK